MAGLNISTFCLAMEALLNRLMSSSVLPENMQPHITSMLPEASSPFTLVCGSKNINQSN
jgi:hypothetical protein